MAESLSERVSETVADRVGEAMEFAGSPQHIPVNVYETTGAYVVVAPLPGVMPSDIQVGFEAGRLTIKAAMRTPAPKDYLLHEWHYGPFERTVELPEDCGVEINATFGNGQLAVSLSKGRRLEPGPVVIRPAG